MSIECCIKTMQKPISLIRLRQSSADGRVGSRAVGAEGVRTAQGHGVQRLDIPQPHEPKSAEPQRAAGSSPVAPSSTEVQRSLVRLWFLGLIAFGYLPALAYGWLVWLMNEEQWRWTYIMYLTEMPLLGGLGIMGIPWLWYRPIHRTLKAWASGQPVDEASCAFVYQRALSLPWRMA